jgi:hypothetical protein
MRSSVPEAHHSPLTAFQIASVINMEDQRNLHLGAE